MASAALPLVLVALVLRLCHGCNLERDEDRLLRLFATWKTDNRRVYNSIDEETLRFGFFSLHVRRADKTARHSAVENADEFGRPVRFSGWADYTAAEMAQHSGGLRVPDLSEQDLAPLDFEFRTLVLFGNWKLEHNKSYDNPAEENSRFANFQCYVRSADGSGASLTTGGDAYGRPTRFSGWADLTQPEMVSRTGMTIEPDGPVHYGHRGFIGGPSPSPWTAIVSSLGGIVQSFSVPAPPVHVDWRNHTRSIVTEVKDQVRVGLLRRISIHGCHPEQGMRVCLWLSMSLKRQ